MKRGGALIALVALIAGCGPADGPVAIRTQPAPLQVCDGARVTGTLVPDPSFGLALANAGYRNGAVWPYGYSARRESGVIVLLDPSGRVVAREGDRILASGGGGAQGEAMVECEITVNPPPGK